MEPIHERKFVCKLHLHRLQTLPSHIRSQQSLENFTASPALLEKAGKKYHGAMFLFQVRYQRDKRYKQACGTQCPSHQKYYSVYIHSCMQTLWSRFTETAVQAIFRQRDCNTHTCLILLKTTVQDNLPQQPFLMSST